MAAELPDEELTVDTRESLRFLALVLIVVSVFAVVLTPLAAWGRIPFPDSLLLAVPLPMVLSAIHAFAWRSARNLKWRTSAGPAT